MVLKGVSREVGVGVRSCFQNAEGLGVLVREQNEPQEALGYQA